MFRPFKPAMLLPQEQCYNTISRPPSNNPHLVYSLLTISVQPDDDQCKRPKHVVVSYTLLLCDIVVLIDWIYIYTIVLHYYPNTTGMTHLKIKLN